MTCIRRSSLGHPILVMTGLVFAGAWGCRSAEDPNVLRASGHVEATDVRLAPEVGGRVMAIDVKEGDRIQAGQRVLTLDPTDITLAIDRARTEQASAEAQLRLVQAAARPEDVRQARAQVDAAQADVVSAQAEVTSATSDLSRYELLLTRGSGAQKPRDGWMPRSGASMPHAPRWRASTPDRDPRRSLSRAVASPRAWPPSPRSRNN